jgi:hypothetical protein
MDRIDLKHAGYHSLPDLLILSGRAERDLRTEVERLGIVIEHRFGQEVVALNEARRLLDQLSRTRPRALPPGYSVIRLVALMRRAIAATGLDLSGMTVLTEAASGAYGVTAVIAAMAGARQVHAFTRPSRYGSVSEVSDWTSQLANAAGVAECIDIIEEISSDILGNVDIVTNSGHLRPLTAALIDYLPGSAVIALMFEAWEFRPERKARHSSGRRQ